MRFNPKVSIIIPVYNGSNYLKEAIDSACAQTYQNIEIIVINDGSNDNCATEKIALSYGERIRYFYKPNGGVSTALNLGIEKMTGEYFSWLSHDDVYYPNKIFSQIDYLESIEKKDVILYSDWDNIDKDSKYISSIKSDHDLLLKKPLYALLRSCINGCTLLIPRYFFKLYGVFDKNLQTTQDYDLWFKMIRKERFVHLPYCLMQCRSHAQQGSYTMPNVTKEKNDLWLMIMRSLTEHEILSCEETNYLFFSKMAIFFSHYCPDSDVLYYSNKMAIEVATRAELQSANAELQSANAELQSANAELQSANAELQSANAELCYNYKALESTKAVKLARKLNIILNRQ